MNLSYDLLLPVVQYHTDRHTDLVVRSDRMLSSRVVLLASLLSVLLLLHASQYYSCSIHESLPFT